MGILEPSRNQRSACKEKKQNDHKKLNIASLPHLRLSPQPRVSIPGKICNPIYRAKSSSSSPSPSWAQTQPMQTKLRHRSTQMRFISDHLQPRMSNMPKCQTFDTIACLEGCYSPAFGKYQWWQWGMEQHWLCYWACLHTRVVISRNWKTRISIGFKYVAPSMSSERNSTTNAIVNFLWGNSSNLAIRILA